MPRGYLKEKEYKTKDLEEFVFAKAKVNKISQMDLAAKLECDRSTLYRKLKNGSLTYKELLELFKAINATGEEITKLLTM